MEQFLKALETGNGVVNTFIWTTLGLVLLLATGLRELFYRPRKFK